MRPAVLVAPAVALAGFFGLAWMQSTPTPQAASPAADNAVTFRVVFGERQERTTDYSGSVSLSAGKVVRLTPWRFFGGDALDGTAGWKLRIKRAVFETQPDQPRPLVAQGPMQNLVPAGVVVTVDAPPTATARIQTAEGRLEFTLESLRQGRALSFFNGDVVVERTPTPQRVSDPPEQPQHQEHDYPSFTITRRGTLWVAWQAYRDNGDHVYARHSTASGWSEVFRLTDQKGDVYRTAVGEDGQGRIWVVWSERTGQEWHLYARTYDGRRWSAHRQLTRANSPNFSHRLVSGPGGDLHLVWVGHLGGNSRVFWSRLQGDAWSQPVEVSGASAWAPDAAADSKGGLWIGWDSYRTGNYDIFVRHIAADGAPDEIRQVTRSPLFQAHASLAVDRQDRLWVAWDESGANWGKDWSHEDPWRATVLYTDRRPQVAVLDGGVWKQPAADLMAAAPRRYNRYVQLPRLACDANGRIWAALQLRTASATNRADYWANNGRWEYFLTSLEGDRWTPLMPLPESSSRPEGPLEIRPAGKGMWMAWTTDSRPLGMGAAFYAQIAAAQQIFAAPFENPAAAGQAALEEWSEPAPSVLPVHPNEAQDVARIRAYRATIGSDTYRIVRGDFHRYTEISGDGSGDGSVEDYFRYMIDAAGMDTGIISDHNAGNNYEYSWWRTEKAIDLFFIPDRYTPLFGYERSVAYPNGHRNVVFAQRGVRTLPISPEENKAKINTGQVLYPYLRQNRGICMLHSLATGQGSDYRDNDLELEPLVELYQGYHASYEYEGAPRAETANFLVRVHGAYQPPGFWWNALRKGLKLGVQASSDHIGTHNSYSLIYTPSAQRTDIVESMRKRHAYAATDNIIVDFRAVDAQGRTHMMGDVFEAAAAPKFQVKIVGTERLAVVEVVKDGKFVFKTEPNGTTAEFTYVDTNPGAGESWYYVRAQQIDRNLAWSSPIWVKYSKP